MKKWPYLLVLLTALSLALGIPVTVAYYDWTLDSPDCGQLWWYATLWMIGCLVFTPPCFMLQPRDPAVAAGYYCLPVTVVTGYAVWGIRILTQGTCADSGMLYAYTLATFISSLVVLGIVVLYVLVQLYLVFTVPPIQPVVTVEQPGEAPPGGLV